MINESDVGERRYNQEIIFLTIWEKLINDKR